MSIEQTDLYQDLKQAVDAELYQEVLKLNDQFWRGRKEEDSFYSLRGWALVGIESYEEALSCFAKAMFLAPEVRIHRLDYSAVLGRLGRYEEALSELDRLVEQDSKDYSALSHRAEAFFKLERYQESLTDIEQLFLAQTHLALAMNLLDQIVASTSTSDTKTLAFIQKIMDLPIRQRLVDHGLDSAQEAEVIC